MKKKIGSLGAAVLYLILMCGMLGRNAPLLFDAGLMGMLIAGGVILCLPHLESGGGFRRMREIFARNALMAGYIETFMLLFVSLQNGEWDGEALLSHLILSFRPLFYGFICYLLFRGESGKEEADGECEAKEIKDADGPLNDFREDAGPRRERDLSLLSSRERQVAELIKRGLSNREIGEELFISEATVKKHVSHIFEKLGIESRRDLM